MTPAAAKLLMCVCAGSTGAVMVPVAHKARAAMARPQVHRAALVRPAAAGPAVSALAAVPCEPLASGGGIAGLPDALPPGSSLGDESLYGRSLPGGGAGGFPAGNGSGLTGDLPFVDAPGPLAGGGNPLVEVPNPVIVPTSGTVPEPASWGLMISGFTLVGSGLRWQRRAIA